MSHPHRTMSSDSTTDGIRKRVCKACDRCRLKKSKCDGASPCSRCKVDNAICVFGERKKSHDKVYPKGYVDMLEQQQSQLVAGLQEMYKRLRASQSWDGPTLRESNGHPLTHDILAALNLLESKNDGSGDTEVFEDDCQKLQSKLIAEGATYTRRRGSLSSESEHSQHSASRTGSQSTPVLSTHATVFKDSFNFGSASPSPLRQSPLPRSNPAAPRHIQIPSPANYFNDPNMYQSQWSGQMPRYPMQPTTMNVSTEFSDSLLSADDGEWDEAFATPSYSQQIPQTSTNGFQGMGDMTSLEGIEVDFNKFLQPQMEMVT